MADDETATVPVHEGRVVSCLGLRPQLFRDQHRCFETGPADDFEREIYSVKRLEFAG